MVPVLVSLGLLRPAAPTFSPSGPVLVVSAAPRRVDAVGALYRDAVWGPFRVYARHVNAQPRPTEIGIAVANPAPFPVVLRTWWVSVGGRRAVRPQTVRLSPGARVEWQTRVAARSAVTLRAGAVASLGSDGPLEAVSAPVVVTVYDARRPPADPDALAALPRAGGLRATFPHAFATLTVRARRDGPVRIVPSRAVWPRLPGVDAVDGVTAWAPFGPDLSPGLRVVLPSSSGPGWVLEARTGRSPPVTVARLAAGPQAKTVTVPLTPGLVRPGVRLTLAPSPAP